jgi:Trm5-related predicted tRNA methylase
MRVLWFAAGTAAGVYASTKVRRTAEALTVDGIHDRLTGWFAGARILGEELRAGAREKETELRGRLSGVPDETDEMDNVLQLMSDPTNPTNPDPEKGDD